MAIPFLGEIRIFSGNYAPNGWALCNGQIIAISQNTALFSLLGTFYGGNGVNTFALPNLQGNVAMHQGNGAGLTPRVVGETGGQAAVALTSGQLPAHTHTVGATASPATTHSPVGAVPASPVVNPRFATLYSTGSPSGTEDPSEISATGSGAPHTNLQPYLALTFIIALEGIFPSRD